MKIRHRYFMLFLCALALFSIALRLGSSQESLWVDELHTSWTSWHTFSEVRLRAAQGNQTPWYFWGLWMWQQVTPSSEIWLRLPSILMTTAGAVVLAVAVMKVHNNAWVGALAGLLLAVESNSIFFGCEARPYAAIILCNAIIAGLSLTLLQTPSPSIRVALPLAVFCCCLLHHTAFIVSACATLICLGLSSIRRSDLIPSGWSWMDATACFIAIASAMLLNQQGMMEVWQRKEQWLHFAQWRGWENLLHLFQWLPLLVIPLSIFILTALLRPISSTKLQRVIVLSAVVFLAIMIVLMLTATGIAPMWHRRYLIGVLPWLCWLSAELWGSALKADCNPQEDQPCRAFRRAADKTLPAVRRTFLSVVCFDGQECPSCSKKSSAPRLSDLSWAGLYSSRLGSLLFVFAIPALLMTFEGSLPRLLQGEFRLAYRGEPWREAVAWINERRQVADQIYVAAELIESAALPTAASRLSGNELPLESELSPLETYLIFPVASIYPLPHAHPWGLLRTHGFQSFATSMGQKARQFSAPYDVWLLARVPKESLLNWLRAAYPEEDPGKILEGLNAEIQAFGSLCVLRIKPP